MGGKDGKRIKDETEKSLKYLVLNMFYLSAFLILDYE